ncbi:MAG: hypothetical protein V9G04_11475 [Nocardioides sp.]
MKIPVVLPVVHVTVDDEGALAVEVDGEPYDAESALTRTDLQRVLDTITIERETAVRVEIRESDGTTYADIAAPPEQQPEAPRTPEAAHVAMPGISGTGFRPGEPIAVAYVLLRDVADADGAAAVQLPPSVIAGRTAGMVLMGLESKVATLVEATA